MAGATDKLKEQAGLIKKPATIQQLMEAMKPQIALTLPRHLTPERMVRVALTAIKTTPKLMDCEPQTILACVMLASQLGLEPGVLGQCYLIPYGKTCTLVPGWRGLLDLVNRAGKASCWTGAVYRGDEFDWQLGSNPSLTHRPTGDDGELTHVYAVGRIKGSDWPIIEVWPIAKVTRHLNRYNKVGERHYAKANSGNFEMYARKVALLQVLKYVPQSIELATAYKVDAAAEMGTQKMSIADVKEAIEGTIEFSPAEIASSIQEGEVIAIDGKVMESAKILGLNSQEIHDGLTVFNGDQAAYLASLNSRIDQQNA
jgi:recombination protein RecT